MNTIYGASTLTNDLNTIELIRMHGSINKAAKATDVARSTLQNRVKSAQKALQVDGAEVSPPVSAHISVKELVARRIQDFAQKRAHEESRSLILVTMKDSLAIGILHFSDHNVDDDGTDLALLPRAHPDAIKVFWDPQAGAEYLSYLRKKDDPLQAPTV